VEQSEKTTQTESEKEIGKLNKKIEDEIDSTYDAILNLASVFDSSIKKAYLRDNGDDKFLAICKMIGEELNINIKGLDEDLKSDDPIKDISRASNIRYRPLKLNHNWFKHHSGPLLAFKEDGEPVALIQNEYGKYEIHTTSSDERVLINQDNAKELLDRAYMFYRPLPEKSLRIRDIFSFISFKSQKDYFLIVLMGAIVGIISLATPIATGIIFDTVIPESNRSQLLEIFLSLVAIGICVSLFNVVRGFTVAKVKGKILLHFESAIWDRLINLPVSFFKDYSTGDLVMRANGISTIIDTLDSRVVSTFLNGIFAIFSFFLLFSYSLSLALVALGLVVFAVAFNIISSLIMLKYQRELLEVSGKLNGFLFDIITGIQKIKLAGAENRVYVRWVDIFSNQRVISYKAGVVQNYLEIFNSIFPILTSIIIFSFVAYYLKGTENISMGDFVAFNSAFGQFISAALAMSSIVATIIEIGPTYKRSKPILEAVPEVSTLKKHPGLLKGSVDINNVSFRYSKDGPNVLDNVSMSINEGEFVAIVGASGSGKSTLFRLLLGFETPNEGNIYYDSKNLSKLDIRAVRNQLGVVLQNSKVLPGSILSNILGSSNKTLNDAWDAAKMAGFDDEIKKMPMGIYTMVTSGGGTLSGGQRQRLIIAGALINNPRIIYFDEATSALDNRTQQIVTDSLDNLNVTRVVIAHRLSTIMNADKIYVLDRGKIVQSGTYSELISEDGVFKKMAKRQIS